MTGLYTFWVASTVGALLFFLAGMVMSRRRQVVESEGTDAQTSSLNQKLEALSISYRELTTSAQEGKNQLRIQFEQSHVAEAESRARYAAQEALLAKVQGELRVASERTQNTASGTNPAQLLQGAQKANDEQVGQMQLKLQQVRASNSDLQIRLNDSLAAQNQHAQHGQNLQQQYEKVCQVRDLLQKREHQQESELVVLHRKVKEGNASQLELTSLRADFVNSQRYQEQVIELKKKIVILEAQGLAATKPLPMSTEAIAPVDKSLPIRQQLLSVVNSIAGQMDSSAIVLADMTGLPVVTAGKHGTELAAFASLVTELAVRASEFLPVAGPDHIDFIDTNGTTLSIWPFHVDSDLFSVVTLSNAKSSLKAKPECTMVRGAVSNVAKILAN